ncbi:MAG: substrate-binding domain-containing protein [Lachnospiraceae bacterium]|nr:substrate-binding domain-containing protein [Lachnospiraceae bacterium]
MTAKYVQIANMLRELIEKRAGDIFQLPTETALCQKYGVSHQTVRKALSVLEDEHLIIKRQGSGSYTTGLLNKENQNDIAILICSNTEYIYPRLLADLCGTLQEHGFSPTVYVTDNRISREREILQYLLKNPVRGILSEGCMTCFPTPNYDLYERLSQKGTFTLFFRGRYSNLPHLPSVTDDHYEGGYSLGKYLVSLGHRNIGVILRMDDAQCAEQCYGYLSALRDAGISFCEDYLCYIDTAHMTALQKKQDTGFLSELLSNQLKNVTAVICCNDEIAYWLIRELTNKNIRIPNDISIVSSECSYLSDLSPIQITSLSHKDRTMGISAAEFLIRLIKGTPAPSQKLPLQLTLKRSSGPPPV